MANISNLYSQYLGRDGSKDAEGQAYWGGLLSSGKMTAEQIGEKISSSAEAQKFKSNATKAPDSYNTPTAQKQRFSIGQQRATAQQKSGPKPTAAYSDNQSDSDFLSSVYQNETGRDADATGRDYWLGQMAGGMSRDKVASLFNQTQEGTGYDNPQQEEKEKDPMSLQGAAQASLPYAKTAAGLLDSILAKDSPLMQRAATQGKQFANNRGLLNSSMAGGAAQGAMIDRATPIASQDSRSALNLSQFNAGQTNDMRRQSNDFQIRSNLLDQESQSKLENLYATSNANAWGVMANNVTDLVGQASAQIQNIQMNPDIAQEDKAALIQQVLTNRDTDIAFQGALYQNLASDLLSTGLFPDSTGTTSVSNGIVSAFRRAGQTPDSGTVEQWRTAIESGQATLADLEAQLNQQATA